MKKELSWKTIAILFIIILAIGVISYSLKTIDDIWPRLMHSQPISHHIQF
jgi:ABC-type antimicrobial peptide transport system permease subunit